MVILIEVGMYVVRVFCFMQCISKLNFEIKCITRVTGGQKSN